MFKLRIRPEEVDQKIFDSLVAGSIVHSVKHSITTKLFDTLALAPSDLNN